MLPVRIAPAAAGLAGDVVLGATGLPVAGKPFLEMGATVPSPTGPKQIPNFEFYVVSTAVVVAPVSGVVVSLVRHPAFDDYGVLIARSASSFRYWVEVDHVSNPTITQGQTVTAGQVVGTSGRTATAGVGRVELQVSDGSRQPVRHYCPNLAFAPAVAAALEAQLGRLMEDIEAQAGDFGLYDEASMFRVACKFQSMLEGQGG